MTVVAGPSDTATGIVVEEVRALVRQRGLDPMREQAAVRQLTREALADYEERALTSGLPPVFDRATVLSQVLDVVAGFGPLQRYLDDPEIEEIWINEPGRVFIARGGRSELTTTILTADGLRDLVERMLKLSGRRLDVSSPFVDAMLPDGSRLHVVIPDITRAHMAVNIRKFVARATSLDDLAHQGAMSHACAKFLEAAVVAGLNIIVAGATQAGKTTMLNCLLAATPARERVITCEEVFELKLPLPDWVPMQTRSASLEGTGAIELRRLVRETLRMRPDRLVIGEVRQAEALDMLIALNSGLPGMCTIHASSAREAVTKLCVLPLLAGPNISASFVVPTVASCIDLVVHQVKDAQGRRHVAEVIALSGRVEGDVVETTTLFAWREGRLVRAEGYPPHAERFAAAGYDLVRLLANDPQGR